MPVTRTADLRRAVGVGLLAGAVAGAVVLGPALRIAMRVVALTQTPRTTAFTVEGTLVVLATGLVGGILVGLPSAMLRTVWSLSPPSPSDAPSPAWWSASTAASGKTGAVGDDLSA